MWAGDQIVVNSGCFWADLLDKNSLCTASHASDVQDVWNVRLSNFDEQWNIQDGFPQRYCNTLIRFDGAAG